MLTTWISIEVKCTLRQERRKKTVCIEGTEQRKGVNIKNVISKNWMCVLGQFPWFNLWIPLATIGFKNQACGQDFHQV